MGMRKMPYNAEILEKISKELLYNKDSNTIEIGGNVEIDGNVSVNGITNLQDYFQGTVDYINPDGEQSQEECYIGVVPFYEQITGDYVYYYGLIAFIADSLTQMGIGYWSSNGMECDGLNDLGDSMGHVSFTKSETSTNYSYDIYPTNIKQYFNHFLTFTLTDNTELYATLVSDRNLVVDSIQDLNNLYGPSRGDYIPCGTDALVYNVNVWQTKQDSINLKSVQDLVKLI